MNEWLFSTDKTFGLWWIIKFFALIFSSYGVFQIITNKDKKMTIAGTLVLAFSGCVALNFNKIDSIVLAEIITILINNIIESKSLKKNILLMLGVIGCSTAYMFTFRPYAIAFGYVFFALILWIIAKNLKDLKKDKCKIITLSITIILSIILAIITNVFFNNNYTENPEGLNSGILGLFSYLYNTAMPFNKFQNMELLGSIFSIFPVPMGLALYYMYKHDKHLDFLLPMTVIAVIETVYCISGFPEFISRFTMLSGAGGLRVMPAVMLANLFILFYFLANVKEELFNIKINIRITILVVCLLVFIPYPAIFSSKGFLYLFASELTLSTFMFLNFADKRYTKVFLFFLVLFSLIGGIPMYFI